MGRLVMTIEDAAVLEGGLRGQPNISRTPGGLSVVGRFDVNTLAKERDENMPDFFYLAVMLVADKRQTKSFYPVQVLNGKIVPCLNRSQLLQ